MLAARPECECREGAARPPLAPYCSVPLDTTSRSAFAIASSCCRYSLSLPCHKLLSLAGSGWTVPVVRVPSDPSHSCSSPLHNHHFTRASAPAESPQTHQSSERSNTVYNGKRPFRPPPYSATPAHTATLAPTNPIFRRPPPNSHAISVLDDEDGAGGVAFGVVGLLANLRGREQPCEAGGSARDRSGNGSATSRPEPLRLRKHVLTSHPGTSFMISFSLARAACSRR